MGPPVRNAESGKSERNYARVAGLLFLWTIVLGLVGGFILSRVTGSGAFAETAVRIAASERLYRVALTTVVMASLSGTLLALALYATLWPVNRLLVGSALFYYLFFNSRYIPRLLSALGIGASVIWAGLYLAKLVFPEQSAVFQYICFPPMVLADVATGFYLLLFSVKTGVRPLRATA
jgi:hypothetical protein